MKYPPLSCPKQSSALVSLVASNLKRSKSITITPQTRPMMAIQSMVSSIAHRLETPRLKAKTRETKGGEFPPILELPENAPALAGWVDRKLSPHDKEEIQGCLLESLATSGNAQIALLCPLFRPPFPVIIDAFQRSRATLEMGESSHTRRLSSYSLDDETNEHKPVSEVTSKIYGNLTMRDILAFNLRALGAEMEQAFHADKSRQRAHRYKSAHSFLRFLVRICNGGEYGEWLEMPEATRSAKIRAFRAYLSNAPAITNQSALPPAPWKKPTPPANAFPSPAFDILNALEFPAPAPSGTVPAFILPPSPRHEQDALKALRANAPAPAPAPWENTNIPRHGKRGGVYSVG